MRYYDIDITDQDGKRVINFNTTNNVGLHIELNAPITHLALPGGEVTLKVFNPPIDMFMRSMDFQDKVIKIKGGMSKGLPLANKAQQGVLVWGNIFFCTGVREGTALFLLFKIYAQNNPQILPKNLVLNWAKGELLSNAIRSTMENAGFTPAGFSITLDRKWIADHDIQAYFSTMKQFSDYISDGISHKKITVSFDNALQQYVFSDGTEKRTPKLISIYDLIGQPVWRGGGGYYGKDNKGVDIGLAVIKVVLRGDIAVGDLINIYEPQPVIIASQAGFSLSQQQRVGFKGIFRVNAINHFANYCSPQGDNWVSVLEISTNVSEITA